MTTNKNKGGTEKPIANIDRLIHEPSRLIIMAHLYVVESADYLFLIRQTGMTWGNLSVHISKLEAAGYLEIIEPELLAGSGVVVGPPLELGNDASIRPMGLDCPIDIDSHGMPLIVVNQTDLGHIGKVVDTTIRCRAATKVDPALAADIEQQS